MRNIIITSICLLLSLNSGFSQDLKHGFIDVEYVVSKLPETEVAASALEGYYQQLLSALEVEYTNIGLMEVEFDSLSSLPEPPRVRLQLLAEKIQMSYLSLEEMQTSAEEELVEKEVELYAPIYDKVDQSLKIVAKEQGYDMVYTIESLVYVNEERITDITYDVLEHSLKSSAPE